MRNLLTISAACEPSDYPVFIMLVCKENSFTKNFMHTLKRECYEMFKLKNRRNHARYSCIGLLKKFEVHNRFDQEMLTKFEM